MTEGSPGELPEEKEREDCLRREYHSQTARISWTQLQTHYARGSVVLVAPDLDLVEVAVQLGLDNTGQFQQWIEASKIAPVSDDLALKWYEAGAMLWAVVAAPWVLVQQGTPGQPRL
jgi:hypothetical protein